MSEVYIDVADKTTLDKVYEILGGGPLKRYGIRIDKNDSNPSTRITYLYDAVGKTPAAMNYTSGVFDYGDWGDVWFVKNNRPVMLRSNGNVAYELCHTDFGKKIDGVTASDITDTAFDGNVMSDMPTVWLSQYEDGNYEYIITANAKIDDTYHAYAHERSDGSIMEHKYLRVYKGSLVGTKLRSLSGQQPVYGKTAQQEIDYATANGSDWYTTAYCDRNLIESLLKIISKTDDSQAAFGNGNLNYNESLAPTYGVMQTGALDTAGQFMGYNDTTHQVKVFYMEAWWADQWERTAGCINDNGDIKVKATKPYNITGEDYVSVGIFPTGSTGGYVSKTKMTEFGRLPVQASGSAGHYTTDGFWFNNTQVDYALAGGFCYYGSRCGASCLSLFSVAAVTHWYFGAGLSCEQPA